MKSALILLPLLLVFCVSSCRREKEAVVVNDPEPAEVDEQVELERWQLAREREALEWERTELERAKVKADAEQAEKLEAMRRDLATWRKEIERQEAEAAAARASAGVTPVAMPQPEPVVAPVADAEEAPLPVEDYGMFHNDLEPYGDWYETEDYGYVWQPTVVVHTVAWRPYCNGRWVWSDSGWCWVSAEPFGWATCHYGRWTRLCGRGWVWCPGSTWAPAWVCWRSGGGHVGWAPLPPECRGRRQGLWGSGVEREFGIGAGRFCFVKTKDFGGPLGRRCLPERMNRELMDSTTNVTLIRQLHGRVHVGGPDYKKLSREVGRRLPAVRLEPDRSGRGDRWAEVSGDRLRVFAPSLGAKWNPLLEPRLVAGRLGRVQVEGERSAAAQQLQARLRVDHAERQKSAKLALARIGDRADLDDLRREQLRRNRERVNGGAESGAGRSESQLTARRGRDESGPAAGGAPVTGPSERRETAGVTPQPGADEGIRLTPGPIPRSRATTRTPTSRSTGVLMRPDLAAQPSGGNPLVGPKQRKAEEALRREHEALGRQLAQRQLAATQQRQAAERRASELQRVVRAMPGKKEGPGRSPAVPQASSRQPWQNRVDNPVVSSRSAARPQVSSGRSASRSPQTSSRPTQTYRSPAPKSSSRSVQASRSVAPRRSSPSVSPPRSSAPQRSSRSVQAPRSQPSSGSSRASVGSRSSPAKSYGGRLK